MKEIKLTQQQVTLVDNEDYRKLSKFTWYASKEKDGYVAKTRGEPFNFEYPIRMHRLIMGVLDKPKIHIDHKDHNTLNNRRENLRKCTNHQNQFNKSSYNTNKTSKYKGVSWYKRDNCWRAQLTHNYKQHHLGYFENEKEAGKAYNKKAKEVFGEFAKLNNV